ncbi:MAG: oxidoreductase, partial [Desulfotignum sp.]
MTIDKQDRHLVESMEIDADQDTVTAIRQCIPLLAQIVERSELLAKLSENDRVALLSAAGKIARPGSEEIRKRKKDKKQRKRRAIVEKEKRLRAATGIRKTRKAPVFTAPLKISGPVSV